MIKQFEHKGKWKLPNSNKLVDGVLRFDPDCGIKLEVYGTFNNAFFDRNSKEIIIGETTHGKITLVENWYSGQKSTSNGVVITYYEPHFIITGNHFEETNEIKFTKVSFSLFNLFPWLNKSGLTYKSHNKEFSITYNNLKNIDFKISEKCNGNISFHSSLQIKKPFNRFEVEEKALINLTYSKQTHFKEILEDIYKFSKFLTLCVFEQSYPIEIFFYSDRFNEEYEGKKIPIKHECIFRSTTYSEKHKIRYKDEHLVPFEMIEGQFQNIIRNWYDAYLKLEHIFDLTLYSFRNKYFFSEDKFMDNVKALESYHRETHCNTRIPQEEYSKKIEKIIKTVELEEKDIEWLRERLRYGNEPSLNKRLKDLIRENQNKYIKYQIPDFKKFCISIVNTRNFYTHYDNSNKNKNVLKGEDLFHATQKLMAILYSCILKHIEIPESCFEKGLEYNLK